MTERQPRYLALIVLGYVLLAITYALATPPLEASDEYKHYPVVQYVQTQRALPILDPDDPGLWLQEATQPPLYYMLMAAITSWIDTADLPEVHQVNRHAFVGDPNQLGNKNLIIHQPDGETFPWDGSVLAVYVIRLFSIVLGAGSILVIARLGTVLFNPTLGLLAAALTAFNPMFIFVNAAVNNDALAILLGNLALYLLVLIWHDTPDPRVRWSRYALLGLVLGLGMMTKLSLAGLLLLSGIALAWLSWRRREWRILLYGGSVVLLAALVVSAPWFVRNMRAYGDPTGLNTFIAVQGTRDSSITLQDWAGEFGTFYRSFWGLFGGVNVAAPELLYTAYNLVALTGAVGFFLWLWRQWKHRLTGASRSTQNDVETIDANGLNSAALTTGDDYQRASAANQTDTSEHTEYSHSGLWLLVAWSGILFILLVRWNIVSPSFQGRLIFPALGALNVLWAVGLLSWASPSRQPRLAAIIAGLFFIVAAALPWFAIRPTYAYPEPLALVPEEVRYGPITFQANGGAIQLVGVELPPGQSVTPGGDPVEITLYWEASQPVELDILSSIHVLGRDLVSEGQVNRYPAWGMIPTSQWQPGQIWRDDYRIYVGDNAGAPARLLIKVGLYDTKQGGDLLALGPAGEEIELLIVGDARLASDRQKDLVPQNLLDMAMIDGLTLLGSDSRPELIYPGEDLIIDLYWKATGTPSHDYTVFVHLVDADGNLIATGDGPPMSGDYPTSFWREGDQIMDEHIMTLPADLLPGTYRISVGFYDPDTLVRVGLLDGTGDTISWPIEVHPGQ
ncbi:MAG: glycosyltransferase family 39 protein [Candidatus Promineifilaceae bacterium]